MGRKTQLKDGRKKTRESAGPKKAARYLEGVRDIDPRDYTLLQKFLTEHGRILPARITGVSARQQRQIKRAIRRARVMGLLPVG